MNTTSDQVLALPLNVTRERVALRRRRGTIWIAGLLFTSALLAALGLGAIPRWRRQQRLAAAMTAAAAATPTVNVVLPHRNPQQAEQTFPGNAQPYYQADIFGRTNGYLKRRLVELGDRVEEGQLLAEISAPDIDAELEQARAAVLQARANLARAQADEAFAKIEEGRYLQLYSKNAGTKEDYDNKVATHKVAIANVGAMQATIDQDIANVQRLQTMQSFQKLTAPFAGVITIRNVDAGDLITADNPSAERVLFRIAATDPLRIFVEVPQVYSTAIKAGQTAVITRRENPGKKYEGRITRTAGAINDNTRTLHTEIQVPNANNELLPGMYLQVSLRVGQEANPLLIPTAAIVARTSGPAVAVLGKENKVRYRAVQLGRDFGADAEILAGLAASDQVIFQPGDDLPEGLKVDVTGSSRE